MTGRDNPETGLDPDTRRDLAALSRELRGGLLAPEFGVLRRRARRRRTRHTAAGLGVVGVVLAVLAGLVLLTPGRDRPTTPTAAPSAPAVEAASGWQTTGVAFAPQSPEGIAVQEGCDSGGGGCRFRTLSTHDDGAHWQTGSALPPTQFTPTAFTPVLPGPTEAALIDRSGQPALASDDRGRTWHQVGLLSATHRVARIDQGARWYVTVRTPFLGVAGTASANDVLAYDLAAGTGAPLRAQPPIPRVTDALAADGGTIWAAGLDRAGHPLVAISRTGGASWRLSRLGRQSLDAVRISDVHGARAVLVGSRVDSPTTAATSGRSRALTALWTTSDGGSTFTAVPRGPTWPASVSSVLVLSDGTLVGRGGGTWLTVRSTPGGSGGTTYGLLSSVLGSSDGGRHFTDLATPGSIRLLRRVAGGDILIGLDTEGPRIKLARTTDAGRTWQTSSLP